MKIAYCGYDFFYPCLESLVKEGHQILKVYSFECDNKYDFNTSLSNTAQKLGIEFSLEKITGKDIIELQRIGCELLVVAAYKHKIPTFEGMIKAINIHPSLLPEGRGPWPLPHVILKKLTETGLTIHKINSEWDKGDILIQETFPVLDIDNLETISAKSQILAVKLLNELLSDINKYWNNAVPQIKSGSYWKMPTLQERSIDWDKTNEEIDRIIRAFGKFESYAHFDGKDWLVQDATIWKQNHSFIPGTIVNKMNKEVVVATKEGLACIRHYSLDES